MPSFKNLEVGLKSFQLIWVVLLRKDKVHFSLPEQMVYTCCVLTGKQGVFYLRLHILEKEKNVGDNWREVAVRDRGPTEAPGTFCSWLQTSPEVRLHFCCWVP